MNSRTNDLLTGHSVRVLDGGTSFLTTAVFYDEKGRVTQTKADNHAGGKDVSTVIYDFIGKVLHTRLKHTMSGQSDIVVNNRFFYDKMGRLLSVLQKNNNDPVVMVSKNRYNEIEQLVEKNLHSTNCTSFLQSIDYSYNALGWLTHMNNADLNNGGSSNNNDDVDDLFGYELKYEAPVTGASAVVGKYDGVITEIHWKAYNDAVKHAYATNHDRMNRLANALYHDYNKNTLTWTGNGRFSEYYLSYDPNGNIRSLKRNGLQTNNNYGLIDHLDYQYNGNQLQYVTENSGVQGYNDFKPMGSNYVYDINGNLTYDPGKNITFVYNHLDLPITIYKNNESVQLVYDAEGNLLNKLMIYCPYPMNCVQTGYAYVNGFTYNQGVLESFPHPEGRVTPNTNTNYSNYQFIYEYSLEDHLGNTRINFADADYDGLLEPANGEVLQQNHYYPFGLDLYGLNNLQVGPVNREKFNEAQHYTELDMNLYNFGPRMYDPALGRWNSPDPLAGVSPNWSPYRFGYDNPTNVSDPSGLLEPLGMAGIGDVYDFSGGGDGKGGDGGGKHGKVVSRENGMITHEDGTTHKIGAQCSGGPSSASGGSSSGGGSGGTGGSWEGNEDAGKGSAAGNFFGGVGDGATAMAGGIVNFATGIFTGDSWVAMGTGIKNTAVGVFNVYNEARNRDMEEADWGKINGMMQSTKTYLTDATARQWGQRFFNGAVLLVTLKSGMRSGPPVARVSAEAAKGGPTIIGEGMKRVSVEATKHPRSVILNSMPKFTGTADQVTSQMMSYNRQWILQQMRSGRPILDIGRDATRVNPSIFYQMEQNMMKNYLKLHPKAFQVIK